MAELMAWGTWDRRGDLSIEGVHERMLGVKGGCDDCQ